MKSGGQYLPDVQGFHGRPMHCAKPMAPHAEYQRKDGVTRQAYRCACGHFLTLEFDAPGKLHVGQWRLS